MNVRHALIFFFSSTFTFPFLFGGVVFVGFVFCVCFCRGYSSSSVGFWFCYLLFWDGVFCFVVWGFFYIKNTYLFHLQSLSSYSEQDILVEGENE